MATVAELKATRCYARSALHQTLEEVIAGCVESVRRYGVSLTSHPLLSGAPLPAPALCIALRDEQ